MSEHLQLSDSKETIMAIEVAWTGFVSWATQRGIQVQIGAWPFSENDLS